MKHRYLKKKDFYIHLSIEDMADADYMHAKIICKNFKINI